MGILQDDTHCTPEVRTGSCRELVQALAVDLNGSTAGWLKPAYHLEQSGFACARGAGDKNELSGRDPKGDVDQNIVAAALGFEDVLKFDHGMS